jgi:nucleotide-binding universal stress UspA family protein
MFKKILVGYDGSKGGRLALLRAIELAKASGGTLTTLWVQEPLPRYSDLPGEPEDQTEAGETYYRLRAQEVESMARERGLEIRCDTRRGHPAKTMLAYADEGGFDLIVLGNSDHSELWGRLLGDMANRVSNPAHCSVLVVKG